MFFYSQMISMMFLELIFHSYSFILTQKHYFFDILLQYSILENIHTHLMNYRYLSHSLSFFFSLSLLFVLSPLTLSVCLFLPLFHSLFIFPPRFPILFSPSSAVDRSINSRERCSGKYDIISR